MALKSSNKVDTNVYEIEVTVTPEVFTDACKSAYMKQRKSIQIPGFRKGKATQGMIEKVYGEGAFYEEALEIVYPQAVTAAIEEAGLRTVDTPFDLDVPVMSKNEGVEMKMKVTVYPEVKLGDYKGLKATMLPSEATDEDIDKEIENMRDRNSRLVSVEDRAAEMGDTAEIDFEGFVDGVAFEGGKGENHPLEIGSHSFIDTFEDQLVGHNAGDEVEVNVTFPEKYQAADLAGKPAVFKVKINEIKAKELPELDDEFAKDVSEFDTLAEYKESLKKDLEKKKQDEAKRTKEDEAIQKIIDKSKMEIPEAMIDTQCETMIEEFAQRIAQSGLSMDQYLQFSGLTVDGLKEQVRPEALTRIQSSLVLEQIAKEENIEVSDADVDAEIEKMAKNYGMEADKLKEYMGEGEKESMKRELAITKAVELIMDNIKERAKAKTKKEKEAEAEAEA